LKQIIQSYKNGNITLDDVPVPACKGGGVLVKNLASLISVGTEKLMIEMGQKSLLGKARARPDLVRQALAKAKKEGFFSVYKEAMNRLDEPIPLGYSAAGIVQEVGHGVQDLKPGDRVAVAGAGYASHAEMVWVPENLCVPLPEGVDFEAGAFVMLGGIALHGVREAALTLGEKAVVLGLGLLGLLSVQFLKAQGCRVVGLDLDRQKCELARELGADLTLVPGQDDIEEAVANFSQGFGADAVIITAASKGNEPILLAEAIARERARVVMVGVAELSLTRKTFWEKELQFSVSKASGPGSIAPLYEAKGFDYPIAYVRWTERRNLEAFLDLIAQDRVRVHGLITHRFPIQDALQAYELILENREPHIGVILQYPQNGLTTTEKTSAGRKVWLKAPSASSEANPTQGLGLIGGGMFTKNILLPALSKISGVPLRGVATTTGVTARHIANKFGFGYATTDYQDILRDASISRVMITTRHNLHGRLVAEALAAGKNVFVEKPLCLTEDELADIEANYDGSRFLMVGFNRRFAPLAQEVKSFLKGRVTPLVMTYRVNAGYIPGDSWVHDPDVGGGRIRGEVCHFLDFLLYMADSEPMQVQATAISGSLGKYRPDDNLSITVTLKDGSVGTIIYTAKGSKSFSRERFEVFCEDSVGIIDDFRRGQVVQGGRTRQLKKFSMDMGYQAEMEVFLCGAPAPAHYNQWFNSYVASTRLTFKAVEALRTGETVKL
jgi:predicted dehydrogenase/threonine dehydrogenase-like Zn-dependent dehydrogenase